MAVMSTVSEQNEQYAAALAALRKAVGEGAVEPWARRHDISHNIIHDLLKYGFGRRLRTKSLVKLAAATHTKLTDWPTPPAYFPPKRLTVPVSIISEGHAERDQKYAKSLKILRQKVAESGLTPNAYARKIGGRDSLATIISHGFRNRLQPKTAALLAKATGTTIDDWPLAVTNRSKVDNAALDEVEIWDTTIPDCTGCIHAGPRCAKTLIPCEIRCAGYKGVAI